MRKVLFGLAFAASALSAPSAFATEAVCATGFDASPATIDGTQQFGQRYTCTGPKIKCSEYFHPVGAAEPVHGPIGGSTDSGPPVMIKNGRMVYTCAEPEPPPK
ncbi:MAG TPA: hypothetical protein VKB71_16705 [Rhizomicrobium sp.]|nr:hypothetical protein [Rhizomicrobium sp.]